MVNLRLYLENIAGDWFGWIEDYPGVYVTGASPQDAARSAPTAVAEYLAWIDLHGESARPADEELNRKECEIQVAQTIETVTPTFWEVQHFMPQDCRPLNAEQFERVLRLLRHSRSDLVEAVRAIPPHEWDSAPPGERSMRSHLLQIAETETRLLGWIGSELPLRTHPDPLATLTRSRAVFEAVSREAFDLGHSAQTERRNAAWSLAKILRLALSRERHITRIVAVRANPSAYLRAVISGQAVVRSRDVADRTESPISTRDSLETEARHTHASGYYY